MNVLLKLSWVFLKIGTFSFGGGIAIIPLVQNEVVLKYGWLTQREFVDAVTLGQITPGPVVVSATFIGYEVYGILGALVSTISVILPSFVMICLATRAVRKFRENKTLSHFFRGARIAVIGLIFEAALGIDETIGRKGVDNHQIRVALGALLKQQVNPGRGRHEADFVLLVGF